MLCRVAVHSKRADLFRAGPSTDAVAHEVSARILKRGY
jgi:hypothetical protein